MYLLVLSLVALALGPVLAGLAGRTSRGAAAFFDRLVLVALRGLVLLHILPHTVAVAAWPALVVAACGFAFPFVVEHVGRRGGAATHALLVPLVMASFGVHAFADGAALVERAADAHEHMLALAIILHRLPDGLAIWSVVRPARGTRVAAIVLGVLAAFTVLGFAVGTKVLEGTPGWWIALLQAFVVGSVLHVVLHRPHAHGDEEVANAPALQPERAHDQAHARDEEVATSPSTTVAAIAGAFAGLAMLVLLDRVQDAERREPVGSGHGRSLAAFALEAAPALVVAVVVCSWRVYGPVFARAVRRRS